MKYLLFSLLLFIPLVTSAQWYGRFVDVPTPGNQHTEYRVTNFPSRLIWTSRDSMMFRFYVDSITFMNLISRDEGNPFKLLWIDNNGLLKASTNPYLLSSSYTAPVNADWNSVSGLSQILNKPTIPAAQVNTDWNSVGGVSQLLNKPNLSIYCLNADTANRWYPLGANPAGYITNSALAPYLTTSTAASTYVPLTRTLTINGTTFDLSANKTWTLTTGNISEGSNLYYTDARARAAISLTTTGSGAATYNNSTGVLNVPTPSNSKRIETYLGTTDASGNYTVTYSTAFSVTPDVQPQLQSGNPQQVVRITSSTTTGFTVNATNRASVTLLGIEVLLAATTPINGASVGVLVTSR